MKRGGGTREESGVGGKAGLKGVCRSGGGWRDGGSGEHEDEWKDWRVVGF
jgi:hypothetical protein